MAIAAVTTAGGAEPSEAGISVTYSINPGSGANKALLVLAVTIADKAITSATFNGVAMTLLYDFFAVSTHLYTWRVIAPADGSQNVVLGFEEGARIASAAIVFSGVHQTAPFSAINGVAETVSPTTQSCNCASVPVGGLVLACAVTDSDAPTVDAPFTVHNAQANSGFSGATIESADGTGADFNATLNYDTVGSTRRLLFLSVGVAEAVAGGARARLTGGKLVNNGLLLGGLA